MLVPSLRGTFAYSDQTWESCAFLKSMTMPPVWIHKMTCLCLRNGRADTLPRCILTLHIQNEFVGCHLSCFIHSPQEPSFWFFRKQKHPPAILALLLHRHVTRIFFLGGGGHLLDFRGGTPLKWSSFSLCHGEKKSMGGREARAWCVAPWLHASYCIAVCSTQAFCAESVWWMVLCTSNGRVGVITWRCPQWWCHHMKSSFGHTWGEPRDTWGVKILQCLQSSRPWKTTLDAEFFHGGMHQYNQIRRRRKNRMGGLCLPAILGECIRDHISFPKASYWWIYEKNSPFITRLWPVLINQAQYFVGIITTL